MLSSLQTGVFRLKIAAEQFPSPNGPRLEAATLGRIQAACFGSEVLDLRLRQLSEEQRGLLEFLQPADMPHQHPQRRCVRALLQTCGLLSTKASEQDRGEAVPQGDVKAKNSGGYSVGSLAWADEAEARGAGAGGGASDR